MATIIIPHQAKVNIADCLSGFRLNNQTYTLHLFAADLTLDDATELADLVADEATFPGYGGAAMANPIQSVIVGDRAVYVFDTVVFTRSAGAGTETIYGAWVRWTLASGDFLQYCWKFDVPITIAIDGQTITIIPGLAAGDIV